ncbi:MAG TPA: glycosyltransferase family 2 protein [Planctomycetota bacterium]|nr:glycosyltransferase family 2 protein [Planctomycetota bacterium]
MKTHYKISVVIPGYNEEANIEATIGRCVAALEQLTDRYEVIIVNDCSTDSTAAIAERLARENPSIRVIHNPINMHVGISVLIGLKAATGDVVVHNSMDYPFHLEDMPKALELFPDADVVIISRENRAAHSLWRKITSLTHYYMVRTLFWVPFTDMNFVQVYRREVLQRIPVKAKSPAFVTPELLIRSLRAGFRIKEVKAVFHRRDKGTASYGKPRDILWTLSDMISFWLEPRKSHRSVAPLPVSSDKPAPVLKDAPATAPAHESELIRK